MNDMNRMRNIVSRLFLFPLCALLWGVVASGCSDEEDGLQPGKYGYVQFKLYKLASYDKDTGGETTQRQTSQAFTRAGADKLAISGKWRSSSVTGRPASRRR